MALKFNGTSDFAVSAAAIDLSSSNKLSVAFWANTPAFSNVDCIWLENGTGAGTALGTFGIDPNFSVNGKATFNVEGGAPTVGTNGITRPTAGVWHHYVCLYDLSVGPASGVTAIYVDGVSVSITSANSVSAANFGNYVLSVGARGSGPSLYSNVAFQQIALWKSTLSAGNIALVFAGAPTDSAVQPNFYWPLHSDGVAAAGGINLTLTGTTVVGDHDAILPVIGRIEFDKFAVSITPIGTAPFTYLWEYSANGSTGWTAFPTGSTTAAPTLTGLPAGALRYVRCTVTDAAMVVKVSSTGSATTCLYACICDGNSLVEGYALVNSAQYPGPNPVLAGDNNAFPSQMQAFLPPTWCIYNFGWTSRALKNTPGTGSVIISDQIADFATYIAPICARAVAAGATVVVLNGGEPGNQIYFDPRAEATVQADAITQMQAYAALVRAAGAKFATMTLPARRATLGNNANAAADWAAWNTWLRANWKTLVSGGGFSDLGADVRMLDNTNVTYFSDLVHCTIAGYNIWAYYAAAAVLGAIADGGASGGLRQSGFSGGYNG